MWEVAKLKEPREWTIRWRDKETMGEYVYFLPGYMYLVVERAAEMVEMMNLRKVTLEKMKSIDCAKKVRKEIFVAC